VIIYFKAAKLLGQFTDGLAGEDPLEAPSSGATAACVVFMPIIAIVDVVIIIGNIINRVCAFKSKPKLARQHNRAYRIGRRISCWTRGD
jgi:hypothetical protein